MANKIIWAVMITALINSGIHTQERTSASDKNIIKQHSTLNLPPEGSHDWMEADEKTDALSPKTSAQYPAGRANLDHLIECLKQQPNGGTGYDSDEAQQILNALQAPAKNKKS